MVPLKISKMSGVVLIRHVRVTTGALGGPSPNSPRGPAHDSLARVFSLLHSQIMVGSGARGVMLGSGFGVLPAPYRSVPASRDQKRNVMGILLCQRECLHPSNQSALVISPLHVALLPWQLGDLGRARCKHDEECIQVDAGVAQDGMMLVWRTMQHSAGSWPEQLADGKIVPSEEKLDGPCWSLLFILITRAAEMGLEAQEGILGA